MKIGMKIVDQINELVNRKGVCFAGFTYNGKRRNVTIGANLKKVRQKSGVPKKTNRKNWGAAMCKGAVVVYEDKMYLQGVENNLNETKIKRFSFDKIEDLRIG